MMRDEEANTCLVVGWSRSDDDEVMWDGRCDDDWIADLLQCDDVKG